MMHHYKARKGFTLAEVLITLGIIGLVAALTLPVLVANYKKHVVETRLEHFYSTINQAVKFAETDYGEVGQWEQFEKEYTYDDYVNWANKYLLPYMKTFKVENCACTNCACIYFSNGSMVIISRDLFEFYPVANKMDGIRGKDCFSFIFSSSIDTKYYPKAFGKGIEPYVGSYYSNNSDYLYNSSVYGCNSQTSSCSRLENANKYCTRIIQENGWKIPKNYPLKF